MFSLKGDRLLDSGRKKLYLHSYVMKFCNCIRMGFIFPPSCLKSLIWHVSFFNLICRVDLEEWVRKIYRQGLKKAFLLHALLSTNLEFEVPWYDFTTRDILLLLDWLPQTSNLCTSYFSPKVRGDLTFEISFASKDCPPKFTSPIYKESVSSSLNYVTAADRVSI